MHVISEKAFRKFIKNYPNSKSALNDWTRTVRKAAWQHIFDVKKIYPSADSVGNFTVFNLNGNKYRLIVGIDYEDQIVYIKYILTHDEYDLGTWKNDPRY